MNRFGLFRSGGLDYAIPLVRLIRVLPAGCCHFLPRLPPGVTGVVVDSGKLIPQVDLARLLPGSGDPGRPTAYQVLVESECGTLALPAEQSYGIVAEQKGKLVSTGEPAALGLGNEFYFQEKVFQVLDIDCLAIGLIQDTDKLSLIQAL